MGVGTAAQKFLDPSWMLEIDSFLNMDFDARVFCDKNAIIARRMQIEYYIGELEGVQIIEPTQHQKKLGIATILSRNIPSHNAHQLVVSRLHTLKYRLNLLAPISQLPIEIIHYILSLRVEHFREPFRLSMTRCTSFSIDSLGWIQVTHVCRAWRAIILQDPNLWTCITPKQPSWAIEMVSRSQHFPLSVAADYFCSSPEYIRTTEIILQQMFRIRELSLIIPEINVLEKELMQPAPILESLAIRVFREFRPRTLPGSLFQGITPILRRLSLNNCQIPWDSQIFHRLTALRLINLVLNISMLQFLDVFRGMPSLETLRVEFQSMSNPSGALVSGAPLVILPRLSTLTIEGISRLCHLFLKYIRLPASPIIHGAFLVPIGYIADASINIVDSLVQHLTDLNPPVRHLTIETGLSLGLRVEGWANEIPTRLDPLHRRLTLRFYSSRPDESYPQSLILEALLSHLSSKGHLRSLSLKDSVQGITFPSGGITLDSITSIVLHDNTGYRWLKDNSYCIRQGILPYLKTIVFVNAVFERDGGASLYQTLSSFLHSRLTLGCVIAKLELVNCKGLVDDELAHLRSLASEVGSFVYL